MFNSYTQFCVEVADLNAEEEAWFRAQHALEPPEDDAEWVPPPWWDEEGECVPFDLVIENDKGSRTAYVESEESGDVDSACQLLHAFLKTFRPTQAIEFEWAGTCDKMRPGAFGGGAAFITAQGIEYMSGWKWLRTKRKEFEAKAAPPHPVHTYPMSLVAKTELSQDALAGIARALDEHAPNGTRVYMSGEHNIEPAEDYALDEVWFGSDE